MMARSLLTRWDEMADKTMPDERNRRSDADAPGAAGASGDASARTSDSAVAASQDGNERVDAPAPPLTRAAAPLITAVEIENFKGIGRPMRVEFRPITLLFGNNSAGKSTVLHALCYAHEILSHRNVDVHRTDIGGDRVDLGGFLNFVHAHDPVRTVRLRFELNLENWRVPQALDEKIVSPFDFLGGGADGYLFGERSPRPRTGWLELHVESGKRQPVLASYELGVNDSLVGRLHTRRPKGVALEFSPAHPLLEWTRHAPKRPLIEQEGDVQIIRPDPQPVRIREAPESETDGWQQSQMAVLGLATPLPYWNELLVLDPHELARSVSIDEQGPQFEALVSALFVGIGQALRDELARFRYIGPVRDLHPRTRAASLKPDPERQVAAFATDFIHGRAAASGSQSSRLASWSDGSAAWTRLHDSPGRRLIDDVNNWLAEKDRLDTGYGLQARSLVTIQEEDAQLVPALREHHRLREQFGNAEEVVDLDQWARQQADEIVTGVQEEIDRATRSCHEIREQFLGVAGADYFDQEVEEAGRGIEIVDRYLRRLGCLRELSTVDALAARIKAPDEDETHAPPAWNREDTRSLARIVARTDARRKHRDEIRKLKVQDDECRDELRKLEAKNDECRDEIRQYGAEYDDAMNRQSQEECRILRKLLKNLATIKENTTTLVKNHARLREAIRKKLDAYGNAVNTERIEARIHAFGIEELDASVEPAQKEYPRLAALVAKMQQRHFTTTEVNALAAALAAGPTQRELQLVAAKTGLPVRPADVGVGISQVLPVVVAALDPDRPGITAIEQPELHLHPKLQVELGDLFAQPVDDGRVFLLENHSEHLMLRLLRRIEETHSGELPEGKPPLRPEQVSVVFIEQIDGEVRATPLRIDETGEFIDRWPHGFFDERADELF